jgi:hypothetical protein
MGLISGKGNIFFFSTSSKSALGPKESPVHWVLDTISLVVKLPGREADQLPPSIAEVKNSKAVCLFAHTPS